MSDTYEEYGAIVTDGVLKGALFTREHCESCSLPFEPLYRKKTDKQQLVDSWRTIADDLADALQSFTAYDGYGQGGAEDSNRGDWRGADKALDAYQKATNEDQYHG